MNLEFLIDLENVKPYVDGKGPIVVVDDDEAQILLIETCYKKSKKENDLVCLRSGSEFLLYLEDVSSGKLRVPELVLLDINMPKISGFEVLEKVRSLNQFENVPIIMMLTTSESEKDKLKAQELKANAYFSKPYDAKSYIEFFKRI
ncbi:MAG: CheY-like chemotaxis protein [Bacteriovoracaceae bacterium]